MKNKYDSKSEPEGVDLGSSLESSYFDNILKNGTILDDDQGTGTEKNDHMVEFSDPLKSVEDIELTGDFDALLFQDSAKLLQDITIGADVEYETLEGNVSEIRPISDSEIDVPTIVFQNGFSDDSNSVGSEDHLHPVRRKLAPAHGMKKNVRIGESSIVSEFRSRKSEPNLTEKRIKKYNIFTTGTNTSGKIPKGALSSSVEKKKKISRITTLVAIILVVICYFFPIITPLDRVKPESELIQTDTTSTEDSSNKCGENVYWDYDSGSATLTIYGSGEMKDYPGTNAPWQQNNMFFDIQKVIIEEGVTSIGSYAFDDLFNATEVIIPGSVCTIGNYSFFCCFGLKEIILPENLISIGDSAFGACDSMVSITLPHGVKDIGNSAFGQCKNLSSITIPNTVNKIGWSFIHDSDNLSDIYYEGTQEQWNHIIIEDGNEKLGNVTVHFYGE